MCSERLCAGVKGRLRQQVAASTLLLTCIRDQIETHIVEKANKDLQRHSSSSELKYIATRQCSNLCSALLKCRSRAM